MISLRRPRVEDYPIEMTPLISISLLLLVFFLLNMSFSRQASVLLDRSITPSQASSLESSIVVHVSSAGTLHVKGTRLDLHALRAAVSELRVSLPKAPVVVAVEESSRASLIVRVIDQLKLTGAEDIRLTVTQENPGADRHD